MTVSVVVMHHPRRAAMLKKLLASMDAPTLVATDPEPDQPGCWACAKRAWRFGLEQMTSHVAVIQDDVAICRDFHRTLGRVSRALATTPVVALYANTKAVEVGDGVRSVPIREVWGQGVMMSRGFIEDFIAWGDEEWRYPAGALRGAYYDSRMGAWMRARDLRGVAVVPSLVDHLAPSDSLLGYNNRTRVARRFIGSEISGLTVWK